jgi:hypothetical protein
MATAVVVASSVTVTGIMWSPNDSTAAPIAPAGYITLDPSRVTDTRSGPKPASFATITVSTGQPGATAVGVNIASTQSTGGGFASAWASGSWPGTASLNWPAAGLDVSNFIIVPVAPDGTFQLITSAPGHLIVDLMGYFAGPNPAPPLAGLSATITGYVQVDVLKETRVLGTATNGTTDDFRLIRVEVDCPGGDLQTDQIFLDALETKGFEVTCDGVHASGATIRTVIDV